MVLKIFGDRTSLSKAAAEQAVAAIRRAITERGQTPKPDFEPSPGQIVAIHLDGTLQSTIL